MIIGQKNNKKDHMKFWELQDLLYLIDHDLILIRNNYKTELLCRKFILCNSLNSLAKWLEFVYPVMSSTSTFPFDSIRSLHFNKNWTKSTWKWKMTGKFEHEDKKQRKIGLNSYSWRLVNGLWYWNKSKVSILSWTKF